VIGSSDAGEDSTGSAEESVGSNSPVSEGEGRGGRAAALRNGSGTCCKSSTARTEETVEKGPGMIKLGSGLWGIPMGAEPSENKMEVK